MDLTERSIRDPVHGWIPFSAQEKELIDSPLMQRLKYVGQLTGVYQVFPGGVHHRFSHSIGAMYIAGLYAEQLAKFLLVGNQREQEKQCISPNLRRGDTLDQINASQSETVLVKRQFVQLARVAALLHDIGHGPWSHAYDRTIYQKIYGLHDGGHDCHRFLMIKSDFLAPYIRNLGLTVADVQMVWSSKRSGVGAEADELLTLPNRSLYQVIGLLVQGPIGADRMDFILRDSYFTGTSHFGTIAARRIIHNCQLVLTGENHYQLVYNLKCLDDLQNALDGRFYMYKGVCFHKTCQAVEILIEKLIKVVADDLELVAQTKDLNRFRDLHDSAIIGRVLALPTDHPGQVIWHRISDRRLPKMIWERLVSEIELNPTGDHQLPLIDQVITYLQHMGLVADDESATDLARQGIYWTRLFGGFDPDKFDQLGIGLWNGKAKKVETFQVSGQRKTQKYMLIRQYTQI